MISENKTKDRTTLIMCGCFRKREENFPSNQTVEYIGRKQSETEKDGLTLTCKKKNY